MAIVTGMTAEKIAEITSDAIVSGAIDEQTGVLTLQQRDGGTVTVGSVESQDAITNAVNAAYPVGSIFMSTIALNPASQLGVGTWVAWGKGRVPVGVDETQTEFDTVEETGGAKTHILSEAELPSHVHSSPQHSHSIDHDHPAFNTSTAGIHGHNTISESANEDGTRNQSKRDGSSNSTAVAADGAHAHTIDVPYYSGSSGLNAPANTGAAGSNVAHNNLQPYITCYMWKRTA